MGMMSQEKECHKFGIICITQKTFNGRPEWIVLREEWEG